MTIEKNLREIQDNIRNSGWRIKHIPWQQEGRPEYYNPGNFTTWLMIVLGFAFFFGGATLFSKQDFPVWVGITSMISGVIFLIGSRYSSGKHLYGRFVKVEGICIDREVQEFEDPDSVGSLIKNTFWIPRILCEFKFKGVCYKVTPIIVKTIAFNTEDGANGFLDSRISKDGNCTLWVNPENPLHAAFHKKPKTGPHTA